MVKIISHSNLIRGLLLSTLVWGLPISFELEAVAQVEIDRSSNITKQEEKDSFTTSIVDTPAAEQSQINEIADANAENNGFLNLNTLIVLTLLSSCALFIIYTAYNKNSYFKQIKTQTKNIEHQTPKQTQNDRQYYSNSKQTTQNLTQKIKFSSNDFVTNKIKTKQGDVNPDYQKPIKLSSTLNKYSSTSKFSTPITTQDSAKPITSVNYISSPEELVSIYHQNPRALSQKVIKVAATRESIEQRRAGIKTPLLFTETSNDSYWIAHESQIEDNHYFLVPKPNLVINSLIYQTIEDIFNCQGYQSRTSNKFQLKLPAIVRSQGSGCWKLVEPGELIFS